jgi:uncharacterized repeat protein (TIGR01451 family)
MAASLNRRVKMQAYLSRVIALALFTSGSAVTAASLFEDGFEQGLAAWTVASTNQGRAVAGMEHAPASGSYHLVLDDAVNDSIASVAEASFTLDLSFRKNVVLQFKAKSLGNEPNPPPAENFTTARNYDGVAISTDGGVTWRNVQSLAALGTTWTTHAVSLDAAITQLGGTFGPGCRVRFSGYDNAPAPFDGIAIDDVSVSADPDQRAIVELPGPVNEGSGPHTGHVVLFSASEAPLTLELFTAPGSPLSLPTSVTVPAGATSASFLYSVQEDEVVTLTRTVIVNASAAGVVATAGSVAVIDNEVAVVSLALPATLKEGETPSDNATLTFNPAPSIALALSLKANPINELTLPTTLTVPAGQNQVTFTARASNDTKVDGDIPIVVMASAAGMSSVSAATIATDNETRALTLTIPATIKEGASGNASVALSGVVPDPVIVSLALGNGAGVTVPSSVTIPAGSTSVSFTIATAENEARDGTRTSPLLATAAGFTSATKNVVVKDNDIASYRFSEFTEVMNLGVPVSMTIQPIDIEGTVITGLTGAVNLELVSADGSTQPTTPASVSFTNSNWSGSITMPAIHATGLRLRARDNGGYSGFSTSFDAMRTLTMKATDLVWNPARNVIYASVAASDTTVHANKVVAIDPVTMQVTGSTATGQDPRRLALAPDGQLLYVSLFGNGRIAKINPATMELISTFAVGSDPSYGTLYAEDICPVAGQPDTLVVSQGSKTYSNHVAEAVYDSGVRRPQTTYGSGSEIEPTDDPSIYVGYQTGSTSFQLSRMQLHAGGMTLLSTKKSVIDGFTTDFQTQGDTIFAGTGKIVNATTLEPTGTFPTTGPMWAELAANRVYFLERYSFSGSYYRILACDPTTHALVRQVSIPSITDYGVASLIRWGNKGLAFRSDNAVRIVSTSLVASEAPANLQVEITAAPNPVEPGAPVTYTVQVTNQGPNAAVGAEVKATLSTGQTLTGATAGTGTPVVAGSTVTLSPGELAAGATVILTLTAAPLGAGNPTCQVIATSRSVDPDGTNNADIAFARVGYQPGPDSINTLRLVAKSMIHDKVRELLWCAIPSSEAAPLGKSVVSIDPATGAVSAPIPLGANPMENSIALSANGRYLYVGLSDIRNLCRIDLQATPPAIVHVPLVVDDYGDTGFANDIEVLEGDGRSVVVGTTGSSTEVNVFDDLTRRGPGNVSFPADSIEPTDSPGTFIAHSSKVSNARVMRLQVTATGLTMLKDQQNIFAGTARRIHGRGDNLLTSNGYLVDSSNLTLKLDLGPDGSPWLDTNATHAYLVDGKDLRSFDTSTGMEITSVALPTTATGDWSLSCTRWGADGMAILGSDGTILILRSSGIGTVDEDEDGVLDTWEIAYFGKLDANLAADGDHDGLPSSIEYLFGSSPQAASVNPLKSSIKGIPDAPSMTLEFPRRSGLANSYRIQTSSDLDNWNNAAGVVETIIAIQTVGGVTTETVSAEIPMSEGLRFARISWVGP